MPTRAAAALIALAALAGCASSPHTIDTPENIAAPVSVLPIDAPAYAAAFDATRDTLRDMGFVLDRVDAQAGVIITQPKGTGGALTPWDREQSAFSEELEDAVNRNQRVVRVEFAPADGSPEPADLRTAGVPLEMRASAVVQRLHHAGWRLNQNNVLGSTYTIDPQGAERGMVVYAVPVRQDAGLARDLVDKVRDRLATTRAAADK